MKKFKRYKYVSGAKFVSGHKPDFFKLLRKNINKKDAVLDIGCGSGELTLRLAGHCKKIIGVDCYDEYIKTAKIDKKEKKILNAFFKIVDARNLQFKDEQFDVVYSSRGPVSANQNFFKEAVRVLKRGGLLIEETIGETNKIELKKIFKRGQNYPIKIKKEDSVNKLVKKLGAELVYSENFIYYQDFNSLESVVRTLDRTPIISDFDEVKDTDNLKKLGKLNEGKGIILSAHRLLWIAKRH